MVTLKATTRGLLMEGLMEKVTFDAPTIIVEAIMDHDVDFASSLKALSLQASSRALFLDNLTNSQFFCNIFCMNLSRDTK